MNRWWGPGIVLLAAVGGAASARFPLFTVLALAGFVAIVAAARNRATATALLFPLSLFPYAHQFGGLLLPASSALLVVVGGVLLLDWALGREPGPLLGPLAVPAVGFVAWTAASIIWAADPGAVLVGTAERGSFVLLGIAVVRTLPGDGRLVRRALIHLVVAAALLGLGTVITGIVEGHWFGVYALRLHKNYLGFVLSFGLVVLLAMALDLGRRPPLAWLAGALPLVAGLLMTGSRGGWIGALAGSAVVVLLKRPALGWPAFSAAVVTAALLFVAAPGLTTERIDTSTADTSAGTRVRTWASGIAAIREHPLLGLGVGNFRAVVKDRGSQVDPNNLTLLTWAETGIFGLIFLIWLLVGVYRLALANVSMPAGTASMASAAGAGIFTAAIAHAQFEIFWTRGVALATFMGVGLVAWAHRHAARPVSLPPHSPAPVGAP